MPYAEKICGIYQIVTPNGNRYVGSSTNVKHRWAEHRARLRRGDHHSARLQSAFNKHGSALAFSLIEECTESALNEREQFYIDSLGAKLNTGSFVGNVWANPETKAKLRLVYSSDAWRESRREIASRPNKRWKVIYCSDGRIFPNMTTAARAFGIRAAGIAHLVKTQRIGRLGVRFRVEGEDWRLLETYAEKRSVAAKARRAREAAAELANAA